MRVVFTSNTTGAVTSVCVAVSGSSVILSPMLVSLETRGGSETRRPRALKINTCHQLVCKSEDFTHIARKRHLVVRAPEGPWGAKMSTIPVGWFEHADADGDGSISGGEAVAFFSRAGLPQASLATLWQLVDIPPRGFLDKKQFDVALQLIYVAQNGGEMNEMQANAIADGYASYPAPNIQGLSNAPAASQQPQMGTTGGDFQISGGGMQNQQYQQTPVQQPAPQTQANGNGFGNFGNSFGDSFGDFGGQGAPNAAGDEPWPPVSPADYTRYTQIFQHHDTDGDGKLAGGEVVPMMMALNAPKEVLKDIWALADADGDGALTKQEFFVAIYLTERARDGRKPPQSLPPGPFPPSVQTQPTAPQMQPVAHTPAPAPEPAPVERNAFAALDEDLFSGGPGPSASGGGGAATFGASVDGGWPGGMGAAPVMQSTAPPPQMEPAAMHAHIPAMPAPVPAMPTEALGISGGPEYQFRGPQTTDVVGGGAEADRLRAAQADAEAADKALWEQENAATQAKANSVSLTQQLQELVMFQRRCEANMEEAAFVARGAEQEVAQLRKRVEFAKMSAEQARSSLDALTSLSSDAPQEKVRLEARLREISTARPALADGSASEASLPAELQDLRTRVAQAEQKFAALPSWADWTQVEDEGIDAVQLSWGTWGRDDAAPSSIPPQQQQQTPVQEAPPPLQQTPQQAPPPSNDPFGQPAPQSVPVATEAGWSGF